MEKPTTLTAPEGQYIDLEESKIVYKAIERVLPKTWIDYVNLTNLDRKLGNLDINFIELSNYDKLILLRDYYNDGYKFYWSYPISKHVINCNLNSKALWVSSTQYYKYSPFYFKSEELGRKFILNFRDMLEEYFINL